MDWAQLKIQFNRTKFVSGIFGLLNMTALGCYLSHYRLWERMAREGVECALVLEDDIEWSGDFFSSRPRSCRVRMALGNCQSVHCAAEPHCQKVGRCRRRQAIRPVRPLSRDSGGVSDSPVGREKTAALLPRDSRCDRRALCAMVALWCDLLLCVAAPRRANGGKTSVHHRRL